MNKTGFTQLRMLVWIMTSARLQNFVTAIWCHAKKGTKLRAVGAIRG